jgi:hypothetical protein
VYLLHVRALRKHINPQMPKKPKEAPKREARLSLTIRDDLFRDFKMQAVTERTSMAELAERMIEEYLKQKK